MTTTTPTVAPATSRPRIDLATTPVWRVGALASLAAALATTLVAVAAKAVDVPLMVAPQSADAGQEIPAAGFATSTLMAALIGTLLAVGLARWSRRPAGTFVVITTVLTLVAVVPPLTTGHATTATRVVLELTHLVAAAIVIPVLARRLAAVRTDR